MYTASPPSAACRNAVDTSPALIVHRMANASVSKIRKMQKIGVEA